MKDDSVYINHSGSDSENSDSDISNKRAVAIRFDPENDNAPVITAVGKGRNAEKIMENAAANNVPVYRDEFQANALSTMDVGSKIPRFLYDLVAEIMVFVEEMDLRKQRGGKI